MYQLPDRRVSALSEFRQLGGVEDCDRRFELLIYDDFRAQLNHQVFQAQDDELEFAEVLEV